MGAALRTSLLADLFLFYGFEMWMLRNVLDIGFERHADDAISHCRLETRYGAPDGSGCAFF
jgi:hypothetical protein